MKRTYTSSFALMALVAMGGFSQAADARGGATRSNNHSYNKATGDFSGAGSVTGKNGKSLSSQTQGHYDRRSGNVSSSTVVTGPRGGTATSQTTGNVDVRSGDFSSSTKVSGQNGRGGTVDTQGNVDTSNQTLSGTANVQTNSGHGGTVTGTDLGSGAGSVSVTGNNGKTKTWQK